MKRRHLSIIFHLSSEKGYTIAELLAVISIFVIISGVMVGIIYSTIRGSSKTKLTTDISQNGHYASTVITNIISDSRNILQINGSDFDSCTASPTSDILSPTPIPGIYPPVDSITLKRIDGGKTVLSCGQLAAGGTETIASNGASLVNMSMVKVSNCKFTCSQLVLDPYSVPIIDVSFTLSPVSAGTYDSQTSSTFNFSTSLRVYSP